MILYFFGSFVGEEELSYPDREALVWEADPHWAVDISNDLKEVAIGPTCKPKPLKVYMSLVEGNGDDNCLYRTYVHEFKGGNDGLYTPILMKALREKFGIEHDPMLCWNKDQGVLFAVPVDLQNQRRLQYRKGQIQMLTQAKEFLLHAIVRAGAPVECVEYVYRACPETIALRANPDPRLEDGYLPLHCACALEGHDSRRGLISFLLRKYPTAVKDSKNYSKQLPIHILLNKLGDRCVHLGMIKSLVEAFPESLEHEDKDGNLPLHIAVRQHALVSLATLQYLVEKSPHALQHHKSPLKLAISQPTSLDKFLALIIPYPQALLGPDGEAKQTRALVRQRYAGQIYGFCLSEAIFQFADMVLQLDALCEYLCLFPTGIINNLKEDSGFHACSRVLYDWLDVQNMKNKLKKVTEDVEGRPFWLNTMRELLRHQRQLEALERFPDGYASDDDSDDDTEGPPLNLPTYYYPNGVPFPHRGHVDWGDYSPLPLVFTFLPRHGVTIEDGSVVYDSSAVPGDDPDASDDDSIASDASDDGPPSLISRSESDDDSDGPPPPIPAPPFRIDWDWTPTVYARVMNEECGGDS